MKYSPNYHRALKMQDALFRDATNPELNPVARAQVARAWDVLEERKRIIRKIPKVKDIDFELLEKLKRKPDNVVPWIEREPEPEPEPAQEQTQTQTAPVPVPVPVPDRQQG